MLYSYHYRKIRSLLAESIGFETVEGRYQLLREAGIPQTLITRMQLQVAPAIAADQIINLLNQFGDVIMTKRFIETISNRYGSGTSQFHFLYSLLNLSSNVGIETMPWPEQDDLAFIEESTREGQDTALPIKIVKQALNLASAIALIRCGTKIGTGIIISPTLLLTCRHVLETIAEAANAEFIFSVQRTLDETTAPDYLLRRRPQGLFYASPNLDYAVVELDTDALQRTFGDRWIHASLSQRVPEKREPIIIIQHSYDTHKLITFSKIAFVEPPRLGYLADTIPGSSGSPVFDRGLSIVGLHRGSSSQSQMGFPHIFSHNQGTLAQAILADMPDDLRQRF